MKNIWGKCYFFHQIWIKLKKKQTREICEKLINDICMGIVFNLRSKEKMGGSRHCWYIYYRGVISNIENVSNYVPKIRET